MSAETQKVDVWTLPKSLVKAAMKSAEDEIAAKHDRGEFDDGDPNHPMYSNGHNYTRPLFGYKTNEFMAKQHDAALANIQSAP